VTEEAKLVAAETGGLMPGSEGWFVLNAKDARWLSGELGAYCNFEGKEVRFEQVGINLNVMRPGEPMTMYHRENAQEDFLVLSGECVLIVQGEERPLRQWDFFHCPGGVDHAIVGAGEGTSLVLAVGARTPESEGAFYPADPVAQNYRAGVKADTSEARDAYAAYTMEWQAYEEGWLPDL
jgi:uncharacterized cupin superfamily protein